MNRIFRIALFAIICFLCSCERRPLVDVQAMTKVRVVLNTDDIPNVTTGIYNEKIVAELTIPEIFRVIFYDRKNNEIVSQEFITRKGIGLDGRYFYEGDVYIAPGSYDMVCYNFDTPSTLVHGERNKNTLEAFTSEISDNIYSRFKSRADAPEPSLYYEPDHLFVAREDGLNISPTNEKFTIVTEARTIIDTYYVQLRLVNGHYAANAVAMITDLAPSNRFGIGEPEYGRYAGTYFEMYRSVDARMRMGECDVLCAVFNTFGKRPDHIAPAVESQLYISFNVLTRDGNSVEMTLDMDSIFKTPQAMENHWLLIDKEIVLPEPDGGGFKPGVEGWDEQIGEIEIGK
jgi:hypothetical protein